jgi:hypothetical protein
MRWQSLGIAALDGACAEHIDESVWVPALETDTSFFE